MVFSRILTWRVSRRRRIRWRQCWMSFKGRLRRLDDKLERVKAVRGRTKEWPHEPVEFCAQYLGFKPTVYQDKLLRDPAQGIRGSMVPSVRQDPLRSSPPALVMSPKQRIQCASLGACCPPVQDHHQEDYQLSSQTTKIRGAEPLKTKIEFYNGSGIQAFPNSSETIRGEPGVNLVYADEFSYIKDDKELYEAAIFSLATTNGRFLATSTPGSRESLFYAMCTDDISFGDVSRHHVSYLDALQPNGPLRIEILEKLGRQFSPDPWRWRREMGAGFANDDGQLAEHGTNHQMRGSET